MSVGKKKVGRPKKSEQQLEKPEIDEQDNGLKFNMEELERWVGKRLQDIENDRQDWLSRRKRYIRQTQDFLRGNHIGPWKDSADYHVPMTMWMSKQMHARFMAALLGDGFGFTTVPTEKLDKTKADRVDQTMRWATEAYANNWNGIRSTIDAWVWDIVTEGWGILKRRWEVKRKKVVLTQEEMDQINELNEGDEPLTSRVQLVTTFDGPVVERVNVEDFYMPGDIKDAQDLDEPDIVAIRMEKDEQWVRDKMQFGGWDKKKTQKVLDGGQSKGHSGLMSSVDDIKTFKDAMSGVMTQDSSDDTPKYEFFECYVTKDVDNDGIAEDLVLWYNVTTGVTTRWFTLDEVDPKMMKRPLDKGNLVLRAGSPYSIGMAEMLYSQNQEINAMHNQRTDFGTLQNMPVGFVKPSAGIKDENLMLRPGVLIPVDNPSTDINFPRINGGTNFQRNEEQLVMGYAERLAALPALTSGQSPSPAGPASTATGITSLLNQVGFDFDIMMKRINDPFEKFLTGMHSDMERKMPNGIEFRLKGSLGEDLFDETGDPRFEKTDRFTLSGKFDFKIKANSRSINREIEKQDALVQLQTLLNPIAIQSGIVTPDNLYEAYKEVLEKRGTLEVSRFITDPTTTEKPLTAFNEIMVLVQGELPRIIMADDHASKVKALTEFKEGGKLEQLISGNQTDNKAFERFDKAIELHEKRAEVVNSQQQLQNQAGLQQSPTLGARQTGEFDQQQGKPTGQVQQEQAVEATQPTGQNPFGL